MSEGRITHVAGFCGSVIEEKLPRAHQAPEDVLESGALFLRSLARQRAACSIAGAFFCGRRAAEREQIGLLDDLLVATCRSRAAWSRRLSFAASFSLSVSPLAMCSAWAMLGSLVRSQSQVCTRSGRPKLVEEVGDGVRVGQLQRAVAHRVGSRRCPCWRCVCPCGKCVGTAVTCETASSITSAIERRG